MTEEAVECEMELAVAEAKVELATTLSTGTEDASGRVCRLGESIKVQRCSSGRCQKADANEMTGSVA
jgi:hypothetical protein